MLKTKNMTEAIGTQMTFILKIKLEKSIFSKIWPFVLNANVAFINPLLGWECVYVYMIKELKRKAIRVKSWNIKEAIGIQMTFISEILFIKIRSIFQQILLPF